MLSLAFIRENPDLVRQALARRHTEAPLEEVLELDGQWRGLLQEVEGIRAERNSLSKEIGELMRVSKDPRIEQRERLHAEHRRDDLVARSGFLGEQLEKKEEELRGLESRLNALLLEIPNLPDERTPAGASEADNVVVREWGKLRQFDFPPRPHWELGESLSIIDFERGVKLSGSRFYVLKAAGARLERALIQWMLDFQTARGYTEIYPPAMVKEECMWKGGWLPKFADNMYHDVEEDYWWLPTAEVALTNLHREEILEAESIPLSYVAYTPCFRREKMSAGRDVRGIKRGHQFDKVELYKLVAAESSAQALETMVADAEAVCQALKIPYRVVQLCTADLGFNSALTYDIEMWAPGCGEWLEVSSCSNCTDFQARRANIRFRREKRGRPEYLHTLNGSGLALPRTLIAVLENYQQVDSSVQVPEVLRPYMGGMRVISAA
ncbi:MAG TPA: serine--tRNA ligase [Dehalococcoidia bacterium]|nr:serine--tRNA ligase [Dehalococcoidia bacterium]